jgi:hypothetical protein
LPSEQGAATRHGGCHGKEPQRSTGGKASGIDEPVRLNLLKADAGNKKPAGLARCGLKSETVCYL